MATWTEFATAAPAMSAAVAARLTAHKHHVLATLRKDGSPRVSGTEVVFTEDGLLRLDSMPNALKAVDLQRDPRFALHANPGHHTMDGGDAKLSGTAVELT
ncbi:MAG: pyridoxamine 5'-phosphate oxidase family protein, partial [Rhodococcus sp. (in: high G+C Gram-positive bacteria)]